ncbi:exodeoxyribonuclease III [Corynebacterium pseudopelargi]|nr:exodeoxyribonuclease III [Corynebacterium pseudopelargi]
MRIANWNVNSARTRADRMVDFLRRQDVDVLAVQETKCKDEQFPRERFEALGYEVAHFGLNQWNGVAILSRVGIEDVHTHFPNQPGFAKDPLAPQNLEARAIGALCGGVRVWSLYVPNGRAIADPHYDYKLRWLYHLGEYIAQELGTPTVLLGDFNIAPRDQDVWDIRAFDGLTHVTEPERQAFEHLLDTGLRVTSPLEGYSYWDYKAGRFGKNEGMLIDFQLASTQLVPKHAFIDVEERSGKGASDHAPVVVDYEVKR